MTDERVAPWAQSCEPFSGKYASKSSKNGDLAEYRKFLPAKKKVSF
jgi:hypothetical protein